MKLEPQALARLAGGIAHALAPFTVVDGDVVLDEARRLAFMSQFSGIGLEECAKQMAVPDVAADVASRFNGLTLQEIEIVTRTARGALWAAHFASLDGTRFGQQWQAALEKTALGDDAKLN